MTPRLLIPVVAVLLTAGCGGGSPDAANAPATPTAAKSSAATKPPKPKFDKAAYAKKIEKAYVEGLGEPIKKACDVTDPASWQCFYDHLEAKDESRVDLVLAFDGGIGEDQAKDLGKRARMAFFNFTGEQFPKLDTIVTFTSDGLDIGTTRRDQVPLLNR